MSFVNWLRGVKAKVDIEPIEDGNVILQNNGDGTADLFVDQGNQRLHVIDSTQTSGGHTIWNAIKTALTQRTKLWFADAKVTDDSTEQATKVEVVQLIDDESELTNAPDGVYQGDYDDAPEDVLDASMIAYKDGSVEDALDELNLNSVSVTADGTKNERVLLNELFALVDLTKLNPQKSFIQTINTNGNYSVYRLNAVSLSYSYGVGAAYFTMEQIVSNQLSTFSIFLSAEVSVVQSVEGGTFHDYSTEVESAGYKFVLYY